MIATTAKLRELLEAAAQPCRNSLWCGRCTPCNAREGLRNSSRPLARLVVALTKALEAVNSVEWTALSAMELHDSDYKRTVETKQYREADDAFGLIHAALADVKELKL